MVGTRAGLPVGFKLRGDINKTGVHVPFINFYSGSFSFILVYCGSFSFILIHCRSLPFILVWSSLLSFTRSFIVLNARACACVRAFKPTNQPHHRPRNTQKRPPPHSHKTTTKQNKQSRQSHLPRAVRRNERASSVGV